MNLKALLGTTSDGLLNISSPKFTEILSALRWTPKKTTAAFYLINYALVTYGDADVWFFIARYNDLSEGIAPANSLIYVPEYQSLLSALQTAESSTVSTLGEEVII